MSSQTTPIDYTVRDYNVIKEAFKVRIQSAFPDVWRDFYESGAGTAITDLLAFQGALLSFQLDYQANETYLPTARDRDSLLKLGRLVGYQMRTPTAASVNVTATLGVLYAQDIIIPAGTTYTTASGVAFVTVDDYRITAGNLTGDIVLSQGIVRTDTFTSDGTAFQTLSLTQTPVIDGTVSVTVDGDAWSEVESLVYSDGDSNVFDALFDEEANGFVRFGDDTSGRIPPLNASIVVTYRTGGGVRGNIGVGEVAGSVQGYREGIMPLSYVTVALSNTERGSGGEAAESVTHAKLWIPPTVKANSRAVTISDFDALANTFSDPVYGAPAYAKARLKQEIPELNTVVISCWARDGEGNVTTPSTNLKNALSDYFNNQGVGAVSLVCTRTEVEDGVLLYVDVDGDIRVDSNYVESTALTDSYAAVESLFDNDTVQPGRDFYISELYSTVSALPAVSNWTVNQITASLLHTDMVGVGDGITTTFNAAIDLEPGLPIVEKTIRCYHGAELDVVTDDGEGYLRNGSATVVGTVDYVTGSLTFTFDSAPADEALVYVEYRAIIDYQRTQDVEVADGVAQRFRGKLRYAPVNPYDVSTGFKGIAFSDGTQTVNDDGDGNLEGDVLGSGRNTIDYATGAYDFTLLLAPAAGTVIRATWRQVLQTGAEDIPVEPTQIPVQGLVSLTAV